MSYKIEINRILDNCGYISHPKLTNELNQLIIDVNSQFVGSTLESTEISLQDAIVVLSKHLRNDEKFFQSLEIGISLAFEENFAVYCKANARKNQFNDEQINYISRNAAKHWLYQFSKNNAIKDFPSEGISGVANSTDPEYSLNEMALEKVKDLIDQTYQLLVYIDDNCHLNQLEQINLSDVKEQWQSILAGDPSAIPFKFFGEKQRQKMDATDQTPIQIIEKQAEELKKQLDLITSQNQLADEQEKLIKELIQTNKNLSVENLKLWACLDQARVIKTYILENKNGIHSSNGFSLIKLTEMLTKLEHLDKLYREQDKKEASKVEKESIDKKLTCAGEQIPSYFEFLDGYFASNTNYGTWHEASINMPYKRLFDLRDEADACYKKLLQERLLQSEVVTDVTAEFVGPGYSPKTHLEKPIRDGFKEGGIIPTSLNVFLADNGLRIIKYTANGVDHLSLRHPDRLPSLQEIHYFRDIFYPDLGQMAYVISNNDPAIGTQGNDTITLIQLFYK